ncbi:glycosyltransferase family 2 protein [Blastococcus sp. TF02-09]|uniref:glycosyltransferase family 2 protein n=1 Tax=Blastococcus sp. TF02-09 TaxID=2250576 RepID=UPI000DE97633|nr:glycosyltransferase family 2 protein [Blastococcus sp. TF02-9]RBY78010.1 glycosyltransferase family 2 protein [Blastococcus sp. TF02-9]
MTAAGVVRRAVTSRPEVVASVRGRDVPELRGVPRVTVVIPCFNYARYLPAAVASALDQPGVAVDVVVVDDASTDDSLAVARALAADDPRVTVVAHAANAGPVATFNDGLAQVTGDYLIRLDADDLLTPGSVQRAVALAEAFPTVGIVYGRPLHFHGDHPPAARTRVRSWTVWSGASWLEQRCHLGVNCITSPEVLMRTSVVREVGGQRDLAHTHDMEMWFRLARASDVGYVTGPDQAWHREHPRSRSATDVDVLTDLDERADAFTTLFTDGLGDPDEDARLLGIARRALAEEAVARVCQAITRGWGGNATTDAYLAFARRQVADLDGLRHGPRLRRCLAVGPARARFVPGLLLGALRYRARTELRNRTWRRTGL